jgi:hypothetical protein
MAKPFICGAEQLREATPLLCELEVGLKNSQKVLLSGDASGLEIQTREQNRLLAELWKIDSLAQAASSTRQAGNSQLRPAAEDSDIAVELQAAAARILHAGRVQAALLARARQRLRMIANVLAGPQAAYAAAATQSGNRASAITCNAIAAINISAREGDRPPCRA